MRKSKLPQALVHQLWEHGLAGKTVYVPEQKSQNLTDTCLPKVRAMIEAAYEKSTLAFEHETLVRGKVPESIELKKITSHLLRKVLSETLDADAIASKFGLKPRTAALIVSRAWKSWQGWFLSEEQPRLSHLRTIAETQGINRLGLFSAYSGMRRQLLSSQPVTVESYTFQGRIPTETIQAVYGLAQASAKSYPWRDA